LRQQIMSQYNDVLQQLGYVNPQGGYVMGDVQLAAERQRRDLLREQGLAELGVTNQMQGAGTLFSGYRAQELARATQPMVSGLADINVALPRQLGGLYEDAMGILREYEVGRNQLLLDAAARRQAEMMEQMYA
jgi:hypothetical protein